jgi:heme-degrading monooxygenase HmoA
MVLYVSRWDISADSRVAYDAWAASAVKKMLAIGGLKEFRAFRPVAGDNEVVVTYEFEDMVAFADWYSNGEVQELLGDARQFTTNMSYELWGASPVAPEPFRPE